MPDSRIVQVNAVSLNIPIGATVRQIKSLALAAGIEASKWGVGELELREYKGSGALLLKDDSVPKGDDFGLREVDPKKEPGFKTLEGWDREIVATYSEYIQDALKGKAYRYFSGSWDDGTIGPPGFMTPHQISGAARVPLVNVYTLSGNAHYHIPGFTWVNERGEPNPYQANGRFLLPIDDALLLVEAFRKYRAYRRNRSGGGLPPEMQGLSEEELQPIRDYIAMMDAEERAGWAQSAHGPDYVKPMPSSVTVTVQAPSEAVIPVAISNEIRTTFKRGWNRFYRANGELPKEVAKLTVKWNGLLRIRVMPEFVSQFGDLLSVNVNGFPLTLTKHKTGAYYQVKLDAEERRRITEYSNGNVS